MHSYFKQYKKNAIDALIRRRTGETKLGEVIAVPGEEPLHSFLEKTTATFIVLGIAEDIGVLANYGNPGAALTWDSFLLSFLNIQSNEYTHASTIAVIGYLSFDELKTAIEKKSVNAEEKMTACRNTVTIIDEAVTELIQLIITHRKVPIIIGGGHNNSYPLIKGTATALAFTDAKYTKGINCINLDAHIDYRLAEGRHSGNGFRYAKQEGFLQKYFALGIHENYIPESVLKDVNETKEIKFTTYEDIFIRQGKTWQQALEEAVKFVGHDYYTGIELDLDSIEYIQSSAITPCGVTSAEAIRYIDFVTIHCKVAYIHICEGITSNDGLVGKLISYLVSIFIKRFHSDK